MKALILAVLILLSGESYGLYTQPDSGGEATSISGDSSSVGEASASADLSTEVSTEVSDSSETIVQIRREIEIAANSVDLNLPYCSQGATAGNVKLTFAFGDMDFTCKVAAAIPQQLSLIKPKLEQAERETEPLRKQALIREARAMMDAVYAEGHMLADHLEWSAVMAKVWDVAKVVGFVVVIALAL